MNYEDVIKLLCVDKNERRGMVTAIGENPDYGEGASVESLLGFRQSFIERQNVLSRFRNYAHCEVQQSDDTYADLVVGILALEVLSTTPNSALSENELARAVAARIQDIISKDQSWTRLSPARIEAYKIVLEAAWLDGKITRDEWQLLDRIRDGFDLSYVAHWVLERDVASHDGTEDGALRRVFPPEKLYGKAGTELDALEIERRLGRKGSVRYATVRAGLLFPISKRLPDGRSTLELLTLPDEIATTLRKDIFERELRPQAYDKLLTTDAIGTQDTLGAIAKAFDIETARTLEDRRLHIMASRVSPRQILQVLANDQPEKLEALALELGAKTFKHAKRNIESVMTLLQGLPDWRLALDPRQEHLERLLEMYKELASRRYQELRQQRLIERDGEVDGLFEDATHFLLSTRFQWQTARLAGSAEDGRVHGADGKLLLWDNKSAEVDREHAVHLVTHEGQFASYVQKGRKDGEVVAFMVVAPEFTEDSGPLARNLEAKWECAVPLVRAADLLKLGEIWKRDYGNAALDLKFFCNSGLYSWEFMEGRLKARDWSIDVVSEP